MKSLYHYLAEASKQYNLRLQVHKAVDEELLEKLKTFLQRYQLDEISEPKRVPITKQLSEYSNFNPDLTQIDIKVGLPVNGWLLLNQLTAALNLSMNDLHVWVDGDPLSINQQQELANIELDAQAVEKGLKKAPLLSTDPDYEDFEEPSISAAYGDKYNGMLLQYLKRVADERNAKPKENGVKLFGWLDNFADDSDVPEHEDFNKDINGVKPVYKGNKNAPQPAPVSRFGNYDDQIRNEVAKKYTNKNGKDVVLKAKMDHIRKESK